jgi:hypothetical protein
MPLKKKAAKRKQKKRTHSKLKPRNKARKPAVKTAP